MRPQRKRMMVETTRAFVKLKQNKAAVSAGGTKFQQRIAPAANQHDGNQPHSALDSLIADPMSPKLLSKPGTELSQIDSRHSALSENALYFQQIWLQMDMHSALLSSAADKLGTTSEQEISG